MREIFDCHVHIGGTDTGQLYYGRLQGSEFRELMGASGIGHALVFPPFLRGGYRTANLELANWTAQYSDLRPLARIGGRYLVLPEWRAWLVRKNIRRMIEPRAADLKLNELSRFSGVKLLPLMDGLPSSKMFHEANRLKLPFLVHGGVFTEAKWIERHILPKIETKLVIAHLGAFPGKPELLDSAIDLARRDPRVYLDTSGIWITSLLERAVAAVPDKILFGSDCPLTHPRVAWDLVSSVVRDPGLRRRIGWEAAKEVFS